MTFGIDRRRLRKRPKLFDQRLILQLGSIELRGQALSFGLQRSQLRLLLKAWDWHARLIIVAVCILRLVPDRIEAVIVLHRDRIVLMGMAFRTPRRQPHPDLQSRIDTIFHSSDSKLFVISATFVVAQGRTMKRGRDFL